jgi:methylase of polypeptide subunit release factors
MCQQGAHPGTFSRGWRLHVCLETALQRLRRHRDRPARCPEGALVRDFFDYPLSEQFDTIIGNPPYVRFQDVAVNTKKA